MAALGPPPVAEIFAEMAEGPRAEGAGPGQAWLDSHGGAALGPFVGGTWLRPKGRKEAQCCEAATGRVVGSVLWGGPEEVAAAVGAAEAAAEQWGRMAAEERALRLERLAEVLERKAAVVAEVEAVASGRPCGEGGGAGLSLGVRGLRVAAAALRAPPPQLQGRGATGVVALVVAPPCSVLGLLWRLTPLLAGGNTAVVLLLPPAEAALGALLLAEMATAGGGVLREGGAPLPPGALNVVCGAPPLPRALRSHPSVRHVVALGDGQDLTDLPWGSPGGPQLSLSRGGRVVVIVLSSADVDSAAAAIVGGVGTPPALFPRGGCVVLAEEGVEAALRQRLLERMGGLRVGDPRAPPTQVGPQPPPPIGGPPPEEVVQAAKEEGAQVFQAPLPPELSRGGRFYPPTLLTGVAPTSRCLREMAVGPLVALLSVRCPTDAVAVAARLPHIGAASVWAQDVSQALSVAHRLPVELLWLNALHLLDPMGGCMGGGGEDGVEAVMEFMRPPWEPPPGEEDPPEMFLHEGLSDPIGATADPTAVAAAIGSARSAMGGWARLPGGVRARVLRGGATELEGGATERLRAELRRWAGRVELGGGAVKEVPGGRAVVTRVPVGVVGVAWSGPRPLRRALELLPPLLALGNAVVLLAPPPAVGPAQRLRKALVAAGMPGGVFSVLPGGAEDSVALLEPQRPDALWLCGGGTAPQSPPSWRSPRLWIPPGGVLGGREEDSEPPPGAPHELELRCTQRRCLWLPGWGWGGA